MRLGQARSSGDWAPSARSWCGWSPPRAPTSSLNAPSPTTRGLAKQPRAFTLVSSSVAVRCCLANPGRNPVEARAAEILSAEENGAWTCRYEDPVIVSGQYEVLTNGANIEVS
ncbi:uncharacterized protein LOC128931735 isoform X2 [Callithrix jacchus]